LAFRLRGGIQIPRYPICDLLRDSARPGGPMN